MFTHFIWWMTSSVGFPSNIGSDWTDLLLLPSELFLIQIQISYTAELELGQR